VLEENTRYQARLLAMTVTRVTLRLQAQASVLNAQQEHILAPPLLVVPNAQEVIILVWEQPHAFSATPEHFPLQAQQRVPIAQQAHGLLQQPLLVHLVLQVIIQAQ